MSSSAKSITICRNQHRPIRPCRGSKEKRKGATEYRVTGHQLNFSCARSAI
ncbi:MAG: phage DNA packaging protein J [Phycisphaeraceae bacterium]|nr:phage DNA packaging protein J [Phycisphaerales bacterium]MCB9860376.1 phage DNA packaging protein J [Phycisphaeraceae bacterium]